MNQNKGMITVYYDGACPSCIRDRHHYEKLAGRDGKNITWFDITGQDEQLRASGIDPYKALIELHVKDENQQIFSEMDAYILLLKRVTLLKPLAWLISLPLVRPILSRIYRRFVDRRLQYIGRL